MFQGSVQQVPQPPPDLFKHLEEGDNPAIVFEAYATGYSDGHEGKEQAMFPLDFNYLQEAYNRGFDYGKGDRAARGMMSARYDYLKEEPETNKLTGWKKAARDKGIAGIRQFYVYEEEITRVTKTVGFLVLLAEFRRLVRALDK